MSSYFSVYKYWANIDKFQLDKGRGVIKAVELWGLVLTFWSQVNEVRLRQWQIFLEDLLSSRYSFRDWGCSSEKKKNLCPICLIFLCFFWVIFHQMGHVLSALQMSSHAAFANTLYPFQRQRYWGTGWLGYSAEVSKVQGAVWGNCSHSVHHDAAYTKQENSSLIHLCHLLKLLVYHC